MGSRLFLYLSEQPSPRDYSQRTVPRGVCADRKHDGPSAEACQCGGPESFLYMSLSDGEDARREEDSDPLRSVRPAGHAVFKLCIVFLYGRHDDAASHGQRVLLRALGEIIGQGGCFCGCYGRRKVFFTGRFLGACMRREELCALRSPEAGRSPYRLRPASCHRL